VSTLSSRELDHNSDEASKTCHGAEDPEVVAADRSDIAQPRPDFNQIFGYWLGGRIALWSQAPFDARWRVNGR
jgi:hypothetical protein